MASDRLSSQQHTVLRTMRDRRTKEMTVNEIFAIVRPSAVPGTVRDNQHRIGGFLTRLNRSLERLGVPNRVRPGKARNTYRLWPSDRAYATWRRSLES